MKFDCKGGREVYFGRFTLLGWSEEKNKNGQFAPGGDINARGRRGEGDGSGYFVYSLADFAGVGGGGLSRADAV